LRVNGITDKNEIEERVVTTIEQVALWDEVKTN
jgi:phosphate transport system ATP-binding protein